MTPLTFSLQATALLFLSIPAYSAIIWNGASGSYTGGSENGNAVLQSNTAPTPTTTASGYQNVAVNATDPHTFRTYNGADLTLTHSLSITDSMGNAVLVNNLRLSTRGQLTSLTLASSIAAGERLNFNFTFDRPIGTFETPGNANPVTGTNAQFSSRFLAINLGSAIYDDVIYRFSNSASPVAPAGETPGAWDYSTAINPSGATNTGRSISGAFNETVDLSFVGRTPGDVLRAAIRDDNSPTNTSNFTNAFTWTLIAGAEDIPVGTNFNFTLDGTPVPEPTGHTLLMLSGLLLLSKRKRNA